MKSLARLSLAMGISTVVLLSLLTLTSNASASPSDPGQMNHEDNHRNCGASATGPAMTDTGCSADLVITKEVTPLNLLHPADTLTYTLTYFNKGPSRAEHVTVIDYLPAGIELTSSSSYPNHEPPVGRGRIWIWKIGALDAGRGGVITLTAIVDTDFAWGQLTRVTNWGGIFATTRDGNLNNNFDSVTQRVAECDRNAVRLVPVPDTVTPAGTSLVRATVTDCSGRPAPDGTLITFSTDSLGTFITEQPRMTFDGVATSTFQAGAVTGVSIISGTTATGLGIASITITPIRAYSLALQAAPSTQVVGGSSVLTATVTDQTGNPVTGATVTFVADLGSVLSPRTTTNGIATSTISSTVVGTAHITATSDAAQGTATVTFVPRTGAALALQVDPPSQVVRESSVLTATVTDQYGNPVTGATVTFVTDLGSVLSPRTTTNGIATSQISSTAAGTAHITATSGVAQGTATVIFTPGAAYSITLQADPSSLVANGASTSAITATLVDQYDNPVVDGTRVSFDSILGAVTSPHMTTQGKAVATFTAGIVSGTAIVSATANGHSGSISLTLLPGTVDLSSSAKLASAGVVSTVGQLTYTVLLTNSGNMVAANVTMTDPIPLGTVFAPGSSTGGATYNLGLNQIEWSGSVPAGGLVRLSYVITVTNIEYAIIINRAFVSLNGVPDRTLTAETWVIPPPPLHWSYLPIIVRLGP